MLTSGFPPAYFAPGKGQSLCRRAVFKNDVDHLGKMAASCSACTSLLCILPALHTKISDLFHMCFRLESSYVVHETTMHSLQSIICLTSTTYKTLKEHKEHKRGGSVYIYIYSIYGMLGIRPSGLVFISDQVSTHGPNSPRLFCARFSHKQSGVRICKLVPITEDHLRGRWISTI